MNNKKKPFLFSKINWYISDFSVLVAVWSLCIAWPLYQVFIAGATFFSAHNAGRTDIFLFVLFLSFGFPIVWALFSTLSNLFSRLIRNVIFAIGVGFPLMLFLSKSFLYQPWSWLPEWGVCILGTLLAALTILITVILTRWRPFWQGQAFGISLALLVIGLFLFSPSIFTFFFSNSSQVAFASKIERIGKGRKPNVVILLFDELSLIDMLDAKDHINETLFPNFAKLSKESLWFPNAYSSTPLTHLAIPSLLTGMEPQKKEVPPINNYYPNNILNYFKETGGKVISYEPITRLNVDSIKPIDYGQFLGDIYVILSRSFLPHNICKKFSIPTTDGKWAFFWNNNYLEYEASTVFKERLEVFDRLLYDLDNIEWEKGNNFVFFHSLLPHGPNEYLYNGYSHNFPIDPYVKSDIPADCKIISHLHHLSYVDDQMARIREKIQEKDKEAILVITADHGINYSTDDDKDDFVTPRDIEKNPAAVTNIPLFFSGKNIPIEINADSISLSDVLPTIFYFLNIELPWKMDGKNFTQKSNGSKYIVLRKNNFEKLSIPVDEYKTQIKSHIGYYSALLCHPSKKLNWQSICNKDFPISGRAVSSFRIKDNIKTNIRDSIANLNDRFYNHIKLGNKFLPTFLKGTTNLKSDNIIAIALNGIIWHVTTTYYDSGKQHFVGYIPPAAFNEGYNKIELFLPFHENGEIYLSTIEIKEGFNIRLVGENDLIYDNRNIKIQNDDTIIQGYVGNAGNGVNDVLEINGWAIDKKKVSGVDEVLLFLDNEAVAFSGALKPRSDVSAFFKDSRFKKSGFFLIVPNITIDDLPHLRLFAISGDFAKELSLPNSFFTKIFAQTDIVKISKTGQLEWGGEKFLPCKTNEIKGVIDIAMIKKEQLIINGWAIDFANKKPAEELLVFINGQARASSKTHDVRTDLVKAFYNEAYLKAGFNIQVPLSTIEFDPDSKKEVKVYGLSSGRYIELVSFINVKQN